MSKIWPGRSARRDGWTSTAEGWSGSATSQRGKHGVSPVIIRASVLGRLLGIRLLRLEADISLFPADLGSSSTAGPSPRVVTGSATPGGTGGLTEAVELPMERMGHTSPQLALRYQHVMAGRDQAIAAALDALVQAAATLPPEEQVERASGTLVSCACNSSAVSVEGFEDLLGGLGPDERPWVLVPVSNPGADVALQGLDALVDSPAEQLVGQESEPPLDLVDPRRTGRVKCRWNQGVGLLDARW
jgi:hypothetical protein